MMWDTGTHSLLVGIDQIIASLENSVPISSQYQQFHDHAPLKSSSLIYSQRTRKNYSHIKILGTNVYKIFTQISKMVTRETAQHGRALVVPAENQNLVARNCISYLRNINSSSFQLLGGDLKPSSCLHGYRQIFTHQHTHMHIDKNKNKF